MSQLWLVHSIHSEASRNLVASVQWTNNVYTDPAGNVFCLLDWYSNPAERFARSCPCHANQPHFGPPPSTFPEFHILLGTGGQAVPVTPPGNGPNNQPISGGPVLTIPQGSMGYARVRNPQTFADALNPALWEAFQVYGVYLGGQTVNEVKALPQAPAAAAMAVTYLKNNSLAPAPVAVVKGSAL